MSQTSEAVSLSNFKATICIAHNAVAFSSEAVSLSRYKASVGLARLCERAVPDSLNLAPEQDRRLPYRAISNLANLGGPVYGPAIFLWESATIRTLYGYTLHM
jgi:hypothetical protein